MEGLTLVVSLGAVIGLVLSGTAAPSAPSTPASVARGRHATVCQNGTIDIKCAAKTKPNAMNLVFVKRGRAVTVHGHSV